MRSFGEILAIIFVKAGCLRSGRFGYKPLEIINEAEEYESTMIVTMFFWVAIIIMSFIIR